MEIHTKFILWQVIDVVRWDVEFPHYNNKTITYMNITMNIPDSQIFNLKYDLAEIATLLDQHGITQEVIDTGFIGFLIYKEVINNLNKQMPQRNVIVSALEFLYKTVDEPLQRFDDIIEIEDPHGFGETLFYIIGQFGEENVSLQR